MKTKKPNYNERRIFYSKIFPNINEIIVHRPYLWPTEAYEEKICLLKKIGFIDPEKMILCAPQILGRTPKSIRKKMCFLENMEFFCSKKGLVKKVFTKKKIENFPALFNYSQSNIIKKLQDLEELGFANPKKMLAACPQILGHKISDICDKMNMLNKLGFDAKKIISNFPQITGYTEENIQGKIEDLVKLGFNDPLKLINGWPRIFSYSIIKIKQKLQFYQKFLKPPLNSIELAEYCTASIAYCQERISLVMRILYDKKLPFDYRTISNCLYHPERHIDKKDLENFPKLKVAYLAYCRKAA